LGTYHYVGRTDGQKPTLNAID